MHLANAALALFRRVDNRAGISDALIAAGFGHDHRGHGSFDPHIATCAVSALQESLEIARTLGNSRNVALATYGLASVAQAQGDFSRASNLFPEALVGFEACDDQRSLAWTVRRIGVLADTMGQTAQAAASFERALPIFHALHDWWSALQIVTQVAGLALATNRPKDAVLLLGAVAAFHDLEGLRPTANENAGRTFILESARSVLGEDVCSAAFAQGRSFTIGNAVLHAHALMQAGDMPKVSQAASSSQTIADLTSRERDVLRMLALGLTDRQIADRLSVSPRTVGGHVTNLLGKLGVESRTAAAVLAIRHGLD